MYFHKNHLLTAASLLKEYDGAIPFAYFLKEYFAKEKKHGSNDRKSISELCYCYFRLGKSLNNIAIAEKIKVGIFLSSRFAEKFAIFFDDDWKQNLQKNLNERIAFVKAKFPDFSGNNIFSFQQYLSNDIDKDIFLEFHFTQPLLFARIRPNKKISVEQKLIQSNINYKLINDNCLAFENSTKIDELFKLDNEIVIQDYSSQHVQYFFELIKGQSDFQKFNVWDCCAASGGKSILIKDVLQNVQLTVSDIRTSILENLKKRFLTAGINIHHLFKADLSQKTTLPFNQKFDIVICDVPCTGSGTWSRTPEQLCFFDERLIGDFAKLQKLIITNVISHIKPKGYFLYITCSVFKQENEDAVSFIQQNFKVTFIESKLIKGYLAKADTMFAALFSIH